MLTRLFNIRVQYVQITRLFNLRVQDVNSFI